MYFAPEMVGLLGCNSPISGVNTIVIFFNITKKKFYILDCLIVYFLLGWLDFWAEIHLVQEEIDLSQKGLEKQNFYIFGLIVYFLLDWLDFWAEVHLV